jgi:predicted transcriptional regulator
MRASAPGIGRSDMEQQTIDRIKAVLTVLSSASDPMLLTEIGERIGLSAQDIFGVAKVMTARELYEKPDKKTNRYQITQKGKEFLINPPEATAKKQPAPKPPAKLPMKLPNEPPAGSGPIVPKKSETAKEDEGKIPSQADIFRSVAEQLSISKAKEAKEGTPSTL